MLYKYNQILRRKKNVILEFIGIRIIFRDYFPEFTDLGKDFYSDFSLVSVWIVQISDYLI